MENEKIRKEVTVETFRSRGPGGQRKNKTETAVRLRHLPTGITVTATEHRFQSQNLKLAFERLEERLKRLRRKRPPRIPVRIPLRAVEKRLEGKKRQSLRKQRRQAVSNQAPERD